MKYGSFNENIREILDKHQAIYNSSGEHKIKDVFDGYESKEEKINA